MVAGRIATPRLISLKVWWRSLRAYSFPATIIPVICAALMVRLDGAVYWPGSGLMLIAALLMHAAVNVLNDCYDFQRGLDREILPGASGVLVGKLISQPDLKRWGMMYLTTGTLLGVLLAWLIDWRLLLLGIAGMMGSYFYSHRFGLKYIGWGEPLVFVMMGPVLFIASCLAAGGRMDTGSLLLSIPFACMVTAIMLINNIRDIEGDQLEGIKTIAMRLGIRGSKILYTALVLMAPLLVLIFVRFGYLPLPSLLALLIVAVEIPLLGRIWRSGEPGQNLQPAPQWTAQIYLLFGVLLAVGLCLGS